MEVSLHEVFHLLFPAETNDHDEAYHFAAREIMGWSAIDGRPVSESLAKRIAEAQLKSGAELVILQRIGKHTYAFTKRSWQESPYRIHILRQRSDSLRAAANAAAARTKADEAWRIKVHQYMSTIATRLADMAGLSRGTAFLRTALQDLAARKKYDLHEIRDELGAMFGYTDDELDALMTAPPTRTTDEQREDPSNAPEDRPAPHQVEQGQGGIEQGSGEVPTPTGESSGELPQTGSGGSSADGSGEEAAERNADHAEDPDRGGTGSDARSGEVNEEPTTIV